MDSVRPTFPIPEAEENETLSDERYRLVTTIMAHEESEAQGWDCSVQISECERRIAEIDKELAGEPTSD